MRLEVFIADSRRLRERVPIEWNHGMTTLRSCETTAGRWKGGGRMVAEDAIYLTCGLPGLSVLPEA